MSKQDIISLKKLAYNIRNMPISASYYYSSTGYISDDLERSVHEVFKKQQDQVSIMIESSLRDFANNVALQIELSLSEETPCQLCRDSDVDPLGIELHKDLF